MGGAFIGLRDKQLAIIEDRLRVPITILRDRENTCIQGMGIERDWIRGRAA